MVRLATVNVLFNLREWDARGELLVAGLGPLDLDVLAVQEVNPEGRTAHWLAERLGLPHVYYTQFREGVSVLGVKAYGIAILSRTSFLNVGELYLPGQGRAAQWGEIRTGDGPLTICNGHYFWYPGASKERQVQFDAVEGWLARERAGQPVVMVGDFNAEPHTPEMQGLFARWGSAHVLAQGREPAYTCPTPLAYRGWRQGLVVRAINLVANRTVKPWRGTLDYVLVNAGVGVRDCRVILDAPHPADATLFPSDHFGVYAEVEVGK